MNIFCYLLLIFIAIESYCQSAENELHKKSDAQFDLFTFVKFAIRNKKHKKLTDTSSKIYKEFIKLIGSLDENTGISPSHLI